MAASPRVRGARRSLIGLGVVIAALVGIIAAGTIWSDASWTPKLALDLEGGTEVILSAQTDNGQDPTQDQLNQAVEIMRQRVDSSGVAEAEITTQGSRNVVVALPGEPSQETLDLVKSSAKLDFRRVWRSATGGTEASTSTAGSDETITQYDGESDEAFAARQQAAADIIAQFDSHTCASVDANDPTKVTANQPVPEGQTVDGISTADLPMISCDTSAQEKLLLSPVDRSNNAVDGTLLDGQLLSDATAGLETTSQGATTNNWAVNLVFNDTGKDMFAKVTSELVAKTSPENRFATVLDGWVIVAPTANTTISDGRAQITGGFDQNSATSLADQLKNGALPMSFEVQSQNKITPTLGTQQLQSGIIAGVIGLLLVIAYSLVQYRTLGLVTVGSLGIAAVVTYLLVTLMSWQEGYRLSLAGIAGLIVAIGITADSFIVYFERIRDELRDGHTLIPATQVGWSRALRTILASDAVNFLAAIVLYILAVGSVRGFAFTLGLTTIVDLLVVMLFTHPMMQLLAGTSFFGEGHRFSGLNPAILGATYRGRGQFSAVPNVPAEVLEPLERREDDESEQDEEASSKRHRGRGTRQRPHAPTIAERKALLAQHPELASAEDERGADVEATSADKAAAVGTVKDDASEPAVVGRKDGE